MSRMWQSGPVCHDESWRSGFAVLSGIPSIARSNGSGPISSRVCSWRPICPFLRSRKPCISPMSLTSHGSFVVKKAAARPNIAASMLSDRRHNHPPAHDCTASPLGRFAPPNTNPTHTSKTAAAHFVSGLEPTLRELRSTDQDAGSQPSSLAMTKRYSVRGRAVRPRLMTFDVTGGNASKGGGCMRPPARGVHAFVKWPRECANWHGMGRFSHR